MTGKRTPLHKNLRKARSGYTPSPADEIEPAFVGQSGQPAEHPAATPVFSRHVDLSLTSRRHITHAMQIDNQVYYAQNRRP